MSDEEYLVALETAAALHKLAREVHEFQKLNWYTPFNQYKIDEQIRNLHEKIYPK